MHVTFVQQGRKTTVDLEMNYMDYDDVGQITIPENDDEPVCP
jgi:hypothetical protein